MLRIRRVRDAVTVAAFHRPCESQRQQQELVLSAFYRTDGVQQLYQLFHLRRQVP